MSYDSENNSMQFYLTFSIYWSIKNTSTINNITVAMATIIQKSRQGSMVKVLNVLKEYKAE